MMLAQRCILAAALLAVAAHGAGVSIAKNWMEGSNRKVEAWVELTVPCRMNAWSIVLSFSERVMTFETWTANNGDRCVNAVACEITNKYGTTLEKGSLLRFMIQVKFFVGHVPQLNARWGNVCGGVVPPPVTSPPGGNTGAPPIGGGKYNYGDVLAKSILFYEAQRSGRLPANNRIPWRKDSALGDGNDVGKDLTGGWYDAGDHVKFGFPMSATTTVIAWGMIRYKKAYEKAGEWQNGLSCIKWPLDYFRKCHVSPNELYGQVGDGNSDHAVWGRPEDMRMHRPAWKIHPGAPGSDLAGETAAAMAAGSIAFKDDDAAYSADLLGHAKQLYEFAKKHRGIYSQSISNAKDFYGSNNYKDELAWAAAWLGKASGINGYYEDAKSFMNELGVPQELSWNDKGIGAALLILEKDPGHGASRRAAEGFVDFWLYKVTKTPKGLAWLRKWGPNRYSANAAFMLQVAADVGIKPGECRAFAEKQINYMLGDNGRSYVVGFGHNPPQRPHHRGASCPNAPAPCNWNSKNNPGPNPHVLTGALVGGPGQWDDYVDDRNDYVKNEVATDYNSGFQSAVAGVYMKYI